MSLVQSATITTSTYSPEYVFTIVLNDIELDELRHHRLLNGCVRLQKNKYKFLNDLAEVLTNEILWHLEQTTP